VHSRTFVVHFYIDFTSLLCRLIELCKIVFLLGENGGVTKTGVGDVSCRNAWLNFSKFAPKPGSNLNNFRMSQQPLPGAIHASLS
jgi:hypothetical protein